MDFDLSPADRELLPTAADVRFYREHGWWISGRLFTDAELDVATVAMDRYYAGERDCAWPGLGAMDWGWKPEHGDVLRKSDYSSLRSHGLARIVRKPLLAACAAILAGCDEIRLWHDQLLYKPADPDEGATHNVGWHTDRGYWKSCTSDRLLTAWVPFHDCPEEMGTVSMIDGSHRWPDNTEALNFFDPDLAKLEARFVTGGAPVVKVPMAMRRGQASFHRCTTIHGSSRNRTRSPRRSLAVHMQDGPNRWCTERQPDGKFAGHCNDAFVRRDAAGNPDYTDPTICPVLWRGGESAARGTTALAASLV
jgi:hypothetical protein